MSSPMCVSCCSSSTKPELEYTDNTVVSKEDSGLSNEVSLNPIRIQFYLAVHGTVNLGDLGGMPTRSGIDTFPGVIFRSSALCFYTIEGLRYLEKELSIGAVVDLRSATEISQMPTPASLTDRNTPGVDLLHGGSKWTNVDIGTYWLDGIKRKAPVATKMKLLYLKATSQQQVMLREVNNLIGLGPNGAGTPAFYESMLTDGALGFGLALRAIASAARQGKPTLFHCSAGKDRTSIVACLLLMIAGVLENIIVANYAELDKRLRYLNVAPTNGSSVQVYTDAMTKSPPATMRYVIRRITEKGGIEKYVTTACNVPQEDVESLRLALVWGNQKPS